MRNLLLVGAICLSFVACKKDSTTTNPNNNNTTTIPSDGWTFDGTKHTQVYCLKQGTNQIVAVDGMSKPNSTFAVHFKTLPTASGTYHIVSLKPDSTSASPSSYLAADEVIIAAANSNSASTYDTYFTNGAEKKDATVTVTNGKIKIEVPEVTVSDFKTTTTHKVTGTMIEN